jgi:NAD-dependent dihydropyrimidine dehydrogenase PreA subunit
MAYVITPLCERAGLCVDVCPTDSIHFVDGNSDWPLYYINPETCIDCGACAAECPNEAIFMADDEPAEYADYVAINENFFLSGPGTEFA